MDTTSDSADTDSYMSDSSSDSCDSTEDEHGGKKHVLFSLIKTLFITFSVHNSHSGSVFIFSGLTFK